MSVGVCRTTVLTLLSTALLTLPLRAQFANVHQDDSWHFNVTPYAWLNGISGVVKAGGATVDLGATSVSDVRLGLHVEVLKKAWVILAEGGYLKYGLQGQVQGTSAELDLTEWMGEGAVGYSFGTMQRWFTVLGGVRYLNVEGQTRVQGQEAGSGSLDIWDPYLGLRFFWGVYERVPIILRGDVGGLQISDVDLSWRITLGAGYRFSDQFTVDGGWRWFDLEYKSGSGDEQVIYDVRKHGPYLALTIGF